MTLLARYLLALLDGLLCGVRVSMGRCALIYKRGYDFRAALKGMHPGEICARTCKPPRLSGAFILLLMLVLEFVLNFLAAPVATRQITARL
jgi:hypothetical protein